MRRPATSTRTVTRTSTLAVTLAIGGVTLPGATHAAGRTYAYPAAPRAAVVETLHGEAVADPFRPLERLDDPAVIAWAEAEDALTGDVLAALPDRDRLLTRVREIARVPQVSVPLARGGRRFFTVRAPGQPSPALRVEEADGSERTLVDPNPAAGQMVERLLVGFVPADDGRRVAYGLSRPGSSWSRWRIHDLERGGDLGDELVGLRATPPAWSADGRFLFYAAAPEPSSADELRAAVPSQDLFAHRVGSRDADRRIYPAPPGGPWSLAPTVTDDGRYLVVAARPGSTVRNRLLVCSLTGAEPSADGWLEIGDGAAMLTLLGSDGATLFVHTDRDAPRGRLVAIDLSDPRPERWRTLVAEGAETISSAALVADRLLAVVLADAVPTVRVFGRDGRLERELPFPHLATTFTGFVGRRGDGEAFVSLNSIALPPTPYRFDPRRGSFTPFRRLELAFRPDDFVLERTFYTARDGTRVPIFLAARRELASGAAAPAVEGASTAPGPGSALLVRPLPTLLYAYGFFGWSAFPWFQPQVLLWLEEGGRYALPGVRGGGEYGEAWHQAAMGVRRQLTLTDTLDALEWLRAEGYAGPGQLAMNGGSVSGFLPAAVVAERPDLIAAATVDIPVADLLRYDRFSGGARWGEELGSPADPLVFATLRRLSPVHNLRPGVCYPATLITVGERDGVASPMHGFKLAAALQDAQACPRPILLDVARGAGHALGATPADAEEIWAGQVAFLRRELAADRE